VSTFSHTDWTVICDHPGCGASERTDQLDMQNGTATEVRKVLRRRGWLVAVSRPEMRPVDFCPDHKGLEMVRRGREAIDRAEADRVISSLRARLSGQGN
jgi:hypothetical protein